MSGSVDLGPFRGAVAPEFAGLAARLRDLEPLLPPADTPAEPFRRNRLVRVELPGAGPVAVKAFPRQGRLRSRLARRFGSKAYRSFEIASALWSATGGTPRPIAYLERWEGGRLAASYFLTEFVADPATFHTELLKVFHDDPDFDRLLNLMDPVAAAVRAMHDAGVRHGDLGNQNIFVNGPGVKFIDLNRGRVREGPLSLRERAFDLSRLTLPQKQRRLFREMYYRERTFAGERPPKALVRWQRFYRWRFWIHTKTRTVRHPIRSWRRARRPRTRRTYPRPRDVWIWDRRTDQAIGVHAKLERILYHALHPAQLRFLPATLVALARLAKAWLFSRGRPFRDPVTLAGGVGMTIHPTPETAERELELLRGLGPVPVLARFCHHETAREWDFTAGLLRRLHDEGHSVSVALVQDRRAVLDPASWRAFLDHVLGAVGDIVDLVEVGHSTNRVKWGIWNLGEYARLLAPLRDWPDLNITGPAINDFEYHYVLAGLGCGPRRFAALSMHLYVDRRGAPETGQYGLSAPDKFFFARMLAEGSRRCADRVVVTEVNWMLEDPGGYAHRFAPYKGHASKRQYAAIGEDDYADYMLRYYLHALCSGMVERVYWWRLQSTPFGLADDEGRPRVAYRVLRSFLEHFRDETFTRLERPDAETWIFRFERSAIAFTTGEPRAAEFPFTWERALDATGDPIEGAPTLRGRPTYLLGVAGR